MDYNTIKLRARQRADEMHEEWIQEHFTGEKMSVHEEEAWGREEDPELDYAADLKKKLLLGELKYDEIEDSMAFILYKALQGKTYDEWRNFESLVDQPNTVITQPAQVAINTDRFSEHLEAFLADKKSAKDTIKETTLDAYRANASLFVDVMGDRVISELTYRDCTDFRDQLTQIPTNRKKRKAYRDKSIPELIAMKLPRDECLKSKTISETLLNLKSYGDWLVKTDVIPKNPFDGVSIEVESESYEAYTVDDLNRIYRSPLFINDGTYFKRDARRSYWWLVAIATFTGARQSEIMQLTVEDVIQKDGVLGFSLLDEEEEKRLKSKAAKRFTPVHSQLKALGIEEYIEQLGTGLLIPNIPQGTRTPGQEASKWYNDRYRGSHLKGFKEQRKVFHSFRHTFIQTALRRGADLLKLQSMVGHELSDMGATKHYAGELFDRYDAPQLVEQIELVQFDGLELEHLDWRAIVRG